MKEPIGIALQEISGLYQRKQQLLSAYIVMVQDEARMLQTGQIETAEAILAAKDKKIREIREIDGGLEIYYTRLCALTGTTTPEKALSAAQPGSMAVRAKRAAIQTQLSAIQAGETANGAALQQLKAALAGEIRQLREAQAAANYGQPGTPERGMFFDRRE